jgi:hypothetical protein
MYSQGYVWALGALHTIHRVAWEYFKQSQAFMMEWTCTYSSSTLDRACAPLSNATHVDAPQKVLGPVGEGSSVKNTMLGRFL